MLSIPITQKETTCGCLQHAYAHVTDKINKTKKRKSQIILLCLNSKESMTTDRAEGTSTKHSVFLLFLSKTVNYLEKYWTSTNTVW